MLSRILCKTFLKSTALFRLPAQPVGKALRGIAVFGGGVTGKAQVSVFVYGQAGMVEYQRAGCGEVQAVLSAAAAADVLFAPPLFEFGGDFFQFGDEGADVGFAGGFDEIAAEAGEHGGGLFLPRVEQGAGVVVGKQYAQQVAPFGRMVGKAENAVGGVPCQYVPAQVADVGGAQREVVHQAVHDGRDNAPCFARFGWRSLLGVPLSLLLAERLGWASALWLVAALGGMALAGLACKLPALPAAPAVALKTKLSLLGDKRVALILTVSLLAAVSSLGMYTFIAPLLSAAQGASRSVAPYLWVWGISGILGSFLIGPLADRFHGALLTLWIMGILTVSLWLLPAAAPLGAWLVMLPIAVWSAVGWALQVPQNNSLLQAREKQHDGNLAVALNESTLYLGSAIGAAAGGALLLQQWPPALLAACTGAVAGIGTLVQWFVLRRES